tara:strand:- start:749 stop:1129 length:381 start_codon:yes stop_codon:yes gene_type:complete
MATFDDSTVGTSTGGTKPSYGQQKRSAPLTRTIRFADGYEHRLLFGLAQHQNPKVFNFTFNKSQADAVKIEAFLDERANNNDSFTFTPPGESSSSQFVCEGWSKSIPYNNRATIQATFRQVFEPTS